jgi:TPR repeat protein
MEPKRDNAVWIVTFLGLLALLGIYLGFFHAPAPNAEPKTASVSTQLNLASRALDDHHPETAVGIYKQLADKGNVKAEYRLANLYLFGSRGIKKERTKALELYKKAAKGGFVSAQSELGHLYFAGAEFDQNFKKARYWLNLAADENDARAQYELGKLWENGWGGEKNLPIAYAWFENATRQGSLPAIIARDALLKAMSRDQVAEGQHLLKTLAPSILEKAKAPDVKTS